MRKDFLQIDERPLIDKKIILDIDGTLVFDGQKRLDREVIEKINILSKNSTIYLCSNGDEDRTKELALSLGLQFVDPCFKKPDPRVVSSVSSGGDRWVVVGDKILTDGILATKINGEFIWVKSRRSSRDSFFTKISYAVDDFFGLLLWPWKKYWKFVILARPRQWIKNVLIFAPLFFAGEFFNLLLLLKTFGAFAVFCLTASAVYVFNDIKDVEADRHHPRKRYRPLASGSVSISQAKVFLGSLLGLVFIGLFFWPKIIPAIFIYLVLNGLYSSYFKNIAIVDLAIVSIFYILRLVVGGEIAQVTISPWIVLCVFFGALFLVAGKRRSELRHDFQRPVLDKYSPAVIDSIILIAASLAISTYGLYSVLATNSKWEVYTVPLVVTVILRLINAIWLKPQEVETPELFILKDKVSLAISGLWFLFILVLIY